MCDATTPKLLALRIANAACSRDLSNGAFRLYALLATAAEESGAAEQYFPVTLSGLMRRLPGVGGKQVGLTTVLKQMQDLRRVELVELQGTLHRNAPGVPVLVRLVSPGGAPRVASEIGRQDLSLA